MRRVMVLVSLLIMNTLQANEAYQAGAALAGSLQSQGEAAMQGFKPEAVLPGFTATPPQAGYYDGVTMSAPDLTTPGQQAWQHSDAGQAIRDSLLNNPREKISTEAPFIQAGLAAKAQVEKLIDGPQDCQPHQVTHTTFSRHVCERDTFSLQECTRTAEVVLEEKMVPADREESGQGTLPVNYSVRHAGVIKAARLTLTQLNKPDGRLMFMGRDVRLNVSWNNHTQRGQAVVNITGLNQTVTAGAALQVRAEYQDFVCGYRHGRECGRWDTVTRPLQGNVSLTLVNHRPVPQPVAATAWREFCPSEKGAGVLVSTVCTEPGGNKTAMINGTAWTASSDCWRYTDTYRVPVISDGTCAEYVKNPACTLATRQCAYRQDGTCLHENATYSCEQKTTGHGQLCGGKFFCSDGRCAAHQAGKSNSFARAVSQLAAVAAAGKDVAAMNDPDVRVFTGKPQFCKKTGLGFNNCCKESGWGSDLGIAGCSSEEKALGQAKERRLTVEVGEYCSKKSLGVCREKKRGYCTFDSKLAQIVQQQGRQWQLGIGFGEPEHPDCQGISVAQLQQIKFDQLDFTAFLSELQGGMALPADNALLERAKQQIQGHLSNTTGGQ